MASPRDVRAGGAYIEIGAIDSGLQAALERAANRLRSFAATVRTIGLTMVGFGAGVQGALFALAVSAGKAGEDLTNMAARTGLTVAQVAALKEASKQAGSTIETLAESIKFLQVNITELQLAGSSVGSELASGFGAAEDRLNHLGQKSNETARKFAILGLSLKDFKGKGTFDQILAISDAMAKTSSPALRARIAFQTMGEASLKLIPLLGQGSAAVRKFYGDMERLGVIAGAEAAAGVTRFGRMMSTIVAQIGAIKDVVGAAAAETFTPYIKATQEVLAAVIKYVNAHRQLVAITISAAGTTSALGFATIGLGITLSAAATIISAFGSAVSLALAPVRLLFGSLGLLAGIATNVSVRLAGITVSLASKAFATASASVFGLGRALLLVVSSPITSGIKAITTLFPTIGIAASFAARVSIASLFGMARAGIAAAGLLASAFATVGPALIATVTGFAFVVSEILVDAFLVANTGIVIALAQLFPVLTVMLAAIDALVANVLLTGLFAIVPGIAAAVSAFVTTFGLLVPAIGIIAAAAAVIIAVKLGAGLVSSVSSAISGLFNYISGVFDAIVDVVYTTITSIFGVVVDLGNAIAAGFSTLVADATDVFNAVVAAASSAATGVLSFFQNIPAYARQAFAYMVDYGTTAFERIKAVFGDLKDILGETFQGALDALQTGDLALAGEIAITGLSAAWQRGVLEIEKVWYKAKDAIVNYAIDRYVVIATAFVNMLGTMALAANNAFTGIRAGFALMAAGIRAIWEKAINATTDKLLVLQAKAQGLDIGALRKQAALDTAQREREAKEELEAGLANISADGKANEAALKSLLDGRIKAIKASVAGLSLNSDAQAQAAIAATQAKLDALLDKLHRSTLRAEKLKGEKEANDAPDANPFDNTNDQLRRAQGAIGTFSGAAIGALFGGGTAQDQISSNTARTAAAAEKSNEILGLIAATKIAATKFSP